LKETAELFMKLFNVDFDPFRVGYLDKLVFKFYLIWFLLMRELQGFFSGFFFNFEGSYLVSF